MKLRNLKKNASSSKLFPFVPTELNKCRLKINKFWHLEGIIQNPV